MTLIERLSAYARLVRLDKPIGTLLLLWPTLWALWLSSHGQPQWRVVAIFVAGTLLMRSAGCAINDFADRDFDPHVKRTSQRPLAGQARAIRDNFGAQWGIAESGSVGGSPVSGSATSSAAVRPRIRMPREATT